MIDARLSRLEFVAQAIASPQGLKKLQRRYVDSKLGVLPQLLAHLMSSNDDKLEHRCRWSGVHFPASIWMACFADRGDVCGASNRLGFSSHHRRFSTNECMRGGWPAVRKTVFSDDKEEFDECSWKHYVCKLVVGVHCAILEEFDWTSKERSRWSQQLFKKFVELPESLAMMRFSKISKPQLKGDLACALIILQ